jgi:hypothetical protein
MKERVATTPKVMNLDPFKEMSKVEGIMNGNNSPTQQ